VVASRLHRLLSLFDSLLIGVLVSLNQVVRVYVRIVDHSFSMMEIPAT